KPNGWRRCAADSPTGSPTDRRSRGRAPVRSRPARRESAMPTLIALRLGHVAGYSVIIGADRVAVTAPDGRSLVHDVPNYGTSMGQLVRRPGFKLGWARFPDDAEVLYFYDRDDDGFGYALNVDHPGCSEWGYAPFGPFSAGSEDAGAEG